MTSASRITVAVLLCVGCGTSGASPTTSPPESAVEMEGASTREAPRTSEAASIFVRGIADLTIDVSVAHGDPVPASLHYLQLWVRAVPREPHGQHEDGTPAGADAQITEDHARALLALLEQAAFFTHARRHHSPGVPEPTTPPPAGSVLGLEPPGTPPHVRVQVRTTWDEWHISATRVHPFDASTRALLESMARATSGEGAAHLRVLASQVAAQ